MKLGVTLPSRVGPIAGIPEFARRAEAAGFASAWAYEIFRDPLLMLHGCATSTERLALGSGIASAFFRSPFSLACMAADIDELSGGRFVCGVGTGAPEALRAFHTEDGRKPLHRMREYLEMLRRSWDYLATSRAEPFDGRHYAFRPPPVNPWDDRGLLRRDIPLFLAGMGPKMLGLVGERADGWIGYFATPQLLDEYVRPNLERGAARSARDAADVELLVEMVCSVSPDRKLAYARARRQVGFYAVHPITDRIAAGYGLLDVVQDLRRRFRNEGVEAFAHTDERLVDMLAIVGTPEEARQKLAEYAPHVDHVALHSPYVPPLTIEDCEDNFANILDAFAPAVTPR